MSFHPPPSYEASSYRQLWSIVPPFVSSGDLHAACLVSREWHRAFAPELWGNPARRFGEDSDEVVFSLSRFRALLPRARLEVRALTHTFQVPQVDADLYEGPKSEWLRDLLDHLPNLQSLILPNHGYLDHHTLLAVRKSRKDQIDNSRVYSLRMLNASGCNNITSAALVVLLQHLPDLIYLDLSNIPGLRNPLLLREVDTLRDLKVLRLRGCRLGDENMAALKFPGSLLSLDLSSNGLTANGVATALKKLPQAYYPPPAEQKQRHSNLSNEHQIFAGGLDKQIADRLKSGRDSLMKVDEILPTFFSQLSLAANPISIEDITYALEHLSLDHLDCGSLSLSNNPYPASDKNHQPSPFLPRKIRMNSQIFGHAFRNLRSLRIHHSIMTECPFTDFSLTMQMEDAPTVEKPISLQAVAGKFLHMQRSLESGKQPGRLRPSMIPNLKVLTLTDMPTTSQRYDIATTFIVFLQDCAGEENLARLEYLFRIQPPDQPPEWDRCPSSSLKLRMIVLEMKATPQNQNSEYSGRRRAQSPWANGFGPTKSATEDPDGEIFMQAGEGDFSFFGDNSNGDLVREGRVRSHAFGHDLSALEDKVQKLKCTDIVPMIAAFRKESKAKYDSMMQQGNDGLESLLCGHWIGEIKVIKRST